MPPVPGRVRLSCGTTGVARPVRTVGLSIVTLLAAALGAEPSRAAESPVFADADGARVLEGGGRGVDETTPEAIGKGAGDREAGGGRAPGQSAADPLVGAVPPDPARLEAAGLDEITRTMVTAAFARTGRELAAIEAGAGGDPSADPRDAERARQRVLDELVDTIGVDHVLVGRHASGLDNRVAVLRAPEGGTAASVGLRAGDVLLAVDGRHVFDLDDVRRLDLTSEDRHLLSVARGDTRLFVTLEAPLARLALRADSVDPARRADRSAERPAD